MSLNEFYRTQRTEHQDNPRIFGHNDVENRCKTTRRNEQYVFVSQKYREEEGTRESNIKCVKTSVMNNQTSLKENTPRMTR